jgi:transposase InsO family protein
MCRVLGISRSGYYAWACRGPGRRDRANAALVEMIQEIHRHSREAYGAVKTWQALRARGITCGRHRVARLRRLHGIEAKRRRRFKLTTHSKHTAWIAPNRVAGMFQAAAPNRLWVGDVTALATRTGWLYLAILLDCYSRKVVGWAMSQANDTALVVAAWEMAVVRRQPRPGLIHHTDRGSPYAADTYRSRLATQQVLSSMSRAGNCYDNAVAESFFSTLKQELPTDPRGLSRDQARSAVFAYIEGFYNRERLHATLGYRTPEAFEQLHGVSATGCPSKQG